MDTVILDRVLNTFKAYIQSSNFDHKGKDDMRVNYFHGSSYNNNNYGSVKDTSKGFVRWLFGGGSHLQNLNRDEHELSDDDRVNAAEIEKYKSKRGNRRHTWVNILNGGGKGKQENPSELDFESDYDNEVGLNIRLDQPLPSNDDDEFDYDFDIHAVSEDINGGGASSDTGANFLGDRLSDNMHSLKRIAKSTEDLREASATEFYNEWDDGSIDNFRRPMKKKNITMEAELKRAAKGQPSFDKFTRYPRGSIVRDEVGYHSDRDDPERSMLARGKSKIHASAATSSGVGRRLTIFSKSIKSGKTRKTTHQFVPGGKYIINATCEYCKKIVKGSESLMCIDYQRRAPIQVDNKKYVEYKRKSARSAKTKSGNSNSPQISPTKNPYLQLQFGNQNQPENDQNELQILSAKGKPLRQRSNTEDSDTTTYIQPLKSAQSDQNIQDNPDEEVTFHMVEESRDDSYDIDPDLALKEEVEAWNATVSKTIFMRGMLKEAGLQEELVRRMFPGIERMIELSNIFVEKLTERQCQSDVVNSLGDIIVEHFTKNGAEIDENYGNFCSYHIQSLALYKIKAKETAIFTYSYHLWMITEHFPDYAYLNQALILVKSTATNVDERIQRYKSIQRLKQIQSKLDQKALSTIQGTPIKKLNLASGHFMLLLEDSLIVRGARGKSIDVQALLLNNLIVLLQEKDQKFYLLPIEQKSPIVPIGKAMIRENAADGCIDDQSENSSLLSPFDQLLEQSKIVDEQIIKLIAEREKVFQEMFNAFTPEDEEQKPDLRPIAIRRRKTMDSKDETDSFIIEKSDSQDSSSIPSSIATTPCNLSPAASERHLYSAVTLSECINRLLLITSQKDNEIESLKGKISCSDNKIKDLDEQLRMKDQKIKEMNTTISNNVQKPSLSLQEVIRKQQTQIVELQMDQKEWEDHQALISRQEEKIKEQQDNINEWKEKYEQLQDELSKKPIRPVIPEIIKTGNVPDNNKVITRKHSAPLSYNAVKRATNLNTSRRHSTFIPSPCLPRAKIIPNQPISTLNDRNNLSTQGTEFLSTSLPNTSSISAISGPTVVDKDVEENSSFSDDEVNKENDSEGLSDSEMIFF
ncbi:uncharacterized protein TRIADDRAFT_54348 [Trichoplax adhaerens]|uniref:ARHGEF1-like PH domain-containing protein n=1 Tax=Trichoplax adhaerens TaxID=10228 RepID=B3RRS6_TRIAD|nr:predicted protein [Trichoplax adhaerens]EDV26920.1 predicted protein [Trichoplax adhaerens]|eukprot:XP_002110916.1 predicted protein [Trichoplax adhaerens]